MRSDRLVRAVLLASLATVLGCDSDDGGKKAECKADATQACSCDGGGDGEQTCKDGKFDACKCGAPAGDSGTPDGGPVALAQLKGRVFDADTGRAIDEAELKAQSGEIAKSDERGNFALKSDKAPEEVVVSKKSYAATVKRAPDKGGYMEVFIKDVDKSVDFDAEKGVKVELDSGSSIDIPPGSVRDAENKAVTGMVNISIADVDGAERKNASALPGDLSAEDKDGKKGSASVHRAMEISIRDSKGAKLTVDKDAKVVADFPAKGADAPAERPAFSFDETKGRWVEDGKAKRTVNDKGERVYRKDIDHLSWHGYGDFFGVLTCLETCVQDGDKKPVAGAQVWLVGASFPGVSTLYTGDNGCVSGDAPRQQEVVLVAQTEAGVSKATRYVTAMTEQVAADGNCDKTDVLVVGEAAASDCPAGYEECGSACTDLATDEANCGKCDTACTGPTGREQVCTAGECGCPAGWTVAQDGCVNTDSDPGHCGPELVDCNATVDIEPQQCVQGKCVAAPLCEYPSQYCNGDCVDVYHNEANCGQCDTACQTGQVCMTGACRSLDDPYLCTSPQGMAPPCETDTNFCNGIEACDPTSNNADYSGCVRSQPPCAQGATCDEELNTCGAAPQCVATQYRTQNDTCGNVSVCLSTAVNGQQFRLANALNCGTADMTPALMQVTDELGAPYDCESCLRNDLMICGKAYGCAAQVDALDCCAQDNSCKNQSCIQEACAAEFSALDTCFTNQSVDIGRCYNFIVDTGNCAIL